MRGLFNPDNPVMMFLGKVVDLLLVNLLWLVCSIPIVTIGASTTALYYVSFKIINKEDVYIVKSYFREFKSNLKQATVIWLILFFSIVFFAFDLFLAVKMLVFENPVGVAVVAAIGFLTFVAVSMLIYAFALQAYFSNTVKNTLKNAAYFSVFRFSTTVGMILCDVAVILLGIAFCPLILPAVPIVINTMFLKRIFNKLQEGDAYAADNQGGR